MEHLLFYGNTRRLTEEELANAVHIDPSQIAGLGPSLEALMEMLRERKRKILATYETDSRPGGRAQAVPRRRPTEVQPPTKLAERFQRGRARRSNFTTWKTSGTASATTATRSPAQLVQPVERLGEKYQVDELAGKYEFTGRETMTVPKALEIKEELETIDKLLKQLEEAKKTAQIGIIDMEELAEVRRAGRHGAARAPCSSRSRTTCASRPSSRGSSSDRKAASS